MTKRVLVCLDLVNEMLAPEGKLAGKGYRAFAVRHDSLAAIREIQDRFRVDGCPVIHVRVSFASGYPDHPVHSPLFGKAPEFGALQSGAWGTEFLDAVAPLPGERVIPKSRVSGFYRTDLEATLREQMVMEVYLVGVATDLAVEATARDAHDRDFRTFVVADCCIAASDEDHAHSLTVLKKFASVTSLRELGVSPGTTTQ